MRHQMCVSRVAAKLYGDLKHKTFELHRLRAWTRHLTKQSAFFGTEEAMSLFGNLLRRIRNLEVVLLHVDTQFLSWVEMPHSRALDLENHRKSSRT